MKSYSFIQYLWMAVPQVFKCRGLKDTTLAMCKLTEDYQATPCWVPSHYASICIQVFVDKSF